jgi:hypothetical protein
MRWLFMKLWEDDSGILVTVEFLLAASTLVLGLTVGLTALRNAIVTEFEELANAILAINHSYSVGGLIGCCSFVRGSEAIHFPRGHVFPHRCTHPHPSVVNVSVLPCP